ncbi:MAG: hypothetical protein RML38_11945 [Bacteroidia bacterium]|nr:hypothetical protein [Bacteroidia bacterium]
METKPPNLLKYLFWSYLIIWISSTLYVALIKEYKTYFLPEPQSITYVTNKGDTYTIVWHAALSIIGLGICALINLRYREKPTLKKRIILAVFVFLETVFIFRLVQECYMVKKIKIYPHQVEIANYPLGILYHEKISLPSKFQLSFFIDALYCSKPMRSYDYSCDTMFKLVLATDKVEKVLLKNVSIRELSQLNKPLTNFVKTSHYFLPQGFTFEKNGEKIKITKKSEGISLGDIVISFLIGVVVIILGIAVASSTKQVAVIVFVVIIVVASIVGLGVFTYEKTSGNQKELTITPEKISYEHKKSLLQWLNRYQKQEIILSKDEKIKNIFVDYVMPLNTSPAIDYRSRSVYFKYPILQIITEGNQKVDVELFTDYRSYWYRADMLRKFLEKELNLRSLNNHSE